MATRKPSERPEEESPPAPGSQRPGPQGGVRETNRRERVKALSDAALELLLVQWPTSRELK